jgi:hypothetical protein
MCNWEQIRIPEAVSSPEQSLLRVKPWTSDALIITIPDFTLFARGGEHAILVMKFDILPRSVDRLQLK